MCPEADPLPPASTGRRPLHRRVVDRFTIRGSLLVGFGLIFALWLALGLDLIGQLAETEARASAVSRRLSGTEDLLSTVHAQVLFGAVYLRDALLDDSDNAGAYRRQLQQTRAAIDQALDAYVPVVDSPGGRSMVAELRAEIRDYWEAAQVVLTLDSERRATEARAALRGHIIPKREAINRISERVRALSRAASDEQQAELKRVYAVVRRRIWEATAALIVLLVAVAFIVTRRAGRLEQRVLENTRSFQRLSAKLMDAQEDERRTIARELHDEIGQELTGIKMELALAERSFSAETALRRPLVEARAMTDRALQTVRDLSQLLHPPILDDLGLASTLEWFLAGFSRRTGVATTLEREGAEPRLPPALELCLYRIVQEATTNVARHAEARTCRVSLRRVSQSVILTVEDDGKGFNADEAVDTAARSRLGLLGIAERVAGFGGTFRVESAAGGRGTRLLAQVPALSRPPVGEETEST